MSLLDDAQNLVSYGDEPTEWVDSAGGPDVEVQLFCGMPVPHGHADDCPWLSLPAIVAALEAANAYIKAVISRRHAAGYRFLPDDDAELLALNDALYGRPTAIVTSVVPSTTC